MKTDKVYIQLLATRREREMLAEVARERDMTMSQLIRYWIRESHKRLQKAA